MEASGKIGQKSANTPDTAAQTLGARLRQMRQGRGLSVRALRLPNPEGIPCAKTPEARLYAARIFLRIGKPQKALEYVPLPSSYYRPMLAREAMTLTDIHLSVGDTEQAALSLGRARALIGHAPFAGYRFRLNALTDQLIQSQQLRQ